MDLSFEGENNFPLPEPASKLDFTEDEDRGKQTSDANEGEQNASRSEPNDESMNDEPSEFDEQTDAYAEPECAFNRPIINQNLMLNKNRGNVQKSNVFTTKSGLQEPVTPALIKRKQFKPWFNSPTDNCLSPCTQKIFKPKKPI